MYNGRPLMNPNYLPSNFDSRRMQSAPKGSILDIGYYVPPSLKDIDKKLPPAADVEASYQRGSTVIRQHNNSIIDDYYKKFAQETLEFLVESPDGEPTVIYQDLDAEAKKTGTTSTEKTTVKETTTNGTGTTQPQKTSKSTKESSGVTKQKRKSSTKQEPPLTTTTTQSNSIQSVPQQTNAAPNAGISQQAPAVVPNGQQVVTQQRQAVPPAVVPNGQQVAIQPRQAVLRAVVPNGQQVATQQRQAAAPAITNQLNDIKARVPMKNESNPVVFFDMVIDNEPRGRIVMELFRHVVPKTAQNFLSLCLHDRGYGYRLSYFHRIIPGFMAQGGDFEKSNGTGGYSIYGEKFNDEGFPYKHDRGGLLSMANSGPNTNGSQFFLTFAPCPHLDNKHVVFGQVLQGFHLLRDFELSGSDAGDPTREVQIAKTGQLQ